MRRHRVKNPPDKPRKYNDHALDALRYLLVTHPAPTPMVTMDIEHVDEPPWF